MCVLGVCLDLVLIDVDIAQLIRRENEFLNALVDGVSSSAPGMCVRECACVRVCVIVRVYVRLWFVFECVCAFSVFSVWM